MNLFIFFSFIKSVVVHAVTRSPSHHRISHKYKLSNSYSKHRPQSKNVQKRLYNIYDQKDNEDVHVITASL